MSVPIILDEKLLTLEEKKKNVKSWITFFRRNVHRFIQMYFGIKLYPHQCLEFYLMGNSLKYAEVASRGTAKSWKAGVFACAIAVLYPGSEIVVVSSSIKQASIIVDKKIRPLVDRYENLNKEVESIVSNNSDNFIRFRNGSIVFVVPLKESARGNRATLIIYEEYRLLDINRVEAIISPFKHPRQAEFLKFPEYSHLIEEPREIFITSSGKDTDPFYESIEDILKRSLKSNYYNCLFVDYVMGLKYNMQTVNQILQEKAKMDEETFRIEYENALIRENKNSFFPSSLFTDARTLKIAYYPQHPALYDPKKNKFAIPLKDGEKVIISVDIALKASDDDDNTIISVDRLIPTTKGYQHNIVYQESMRGTNSIVQALRIKQLWYDFSASYIVLDANNAGTAIYDIMTEQTIDTTRGIEYPPMTVFYHKSISRYEDYKQRTRSPNAIPVIYPMWATETINSEMAYMCRDALKTDRLRMMCLPQVGEEFLMEQAKYFDANKDLSLLSWFMRPYYQASETQNEMVNLIPTFSENKVKLVEPSQGRKDRYVSVAYGVWFTKTVLDPGIVKEVKEIKPEDIVMLAAPQKNNMSCGHFGKRVKSLRRTLFGR